MRAWLARDVLRFRVLEREVAVKRVHLTTLLLAAAIGLVVGLAIGFTAGFHYPYRVLPRPPLPAGQVAPTPDCHHTMGGCLPKPKTPKRAGDPAIQGPDLSNNDPVYSGAAWNLIAAHNRFAIFKLTEGTGYVDPTARPMVLLARARHLAVGGYDFLHVCLVDPRAEATVFVAAWRKDGLGGPGSLPPVGDVEYPSSPSCNVRAWLSGWLGAVQAALRVAPMLYSGAWWWQPHVGCWWPARTLAWISGYGVRYPFLPCGRSQLDLWQFSDHGWNGYNAADLSVWRDGAQAFQALTGRGVPAVDPYAIYPRVRFSLASGIAASEHNTVSTWDKAKCRNPVRRAVCKSSRYHLSLLANRIWFVAHHKVLRGRWVTVGNPRWGSAHLGARFQGIERRLHA